MKNTLLCLLFSFFATLSSAQPGGGPPNAKPGKCYSKCTFPTYIISERFPVFIGLDTNGIVLDTILIGSKKVKKWVIKNTKDMPNAQNVAWRMVGGESPPDMLVIVVDTTQTDEYYWQTYYNKDNATESGSSEWIEVICGDKINSYFVRRLAKKLTESGYSCDDNGEMNTKLMTQLKQYQEDNGLPIGNLNMKTLEKLNFKL